ncbi:uncharacterized protein LOC141607804 [Silene latifolia]|uniref:uncharacterized protein LOC141607804 n=1 Tax=Silene latifolia TaxID=37657 RepID=UPI003D775F17
MFCIVKKLKALKNVLKDLNKECYSDIEVKTEEAELTLAEIQSHIMGDPMNPSLITREREAMENLRVLTKAKYSFLQQKAKIKWTDDGDINSAYFHANIKKRCIRNTIIQIEDQQGNVCTDNQSIQDAFLEYYNGLLGSRKVKQMVFSIPIDKASGPDWYSSGFFRDSWDLIGSDVVDVVQDFFNTG